jgi:glutaconate CoA-transferase subunit B
MTVDPEDRMIVAGSRMLRNHRVVFAGVGAPLIASVLAQQLHAPDLTIVLEGGYIGPKMLPGKLPISTNEMRGARRSVMLTGIVDTFLFAQRGRFDYGIVGAAQIDRYGNVNTTLIGDPAHPKVRLPGSGGANDIVSSCREVFVMTRHEPRRFVERVDFVTSPGWLDGGDSRERAGLTKSRPAAVITDLAVLDYEPESKRMRLAALQPGVSTEEVVQATGFELVLPREVRELAPPRADELSALRRLREGPTVDAPKPDAMVGGTVPGSASGTDADSMEEVARS